MLDLVTHLTGRVTGVCCPPPTALRMAIQPAGMDITAPMDGPTRAQREDVGAQGHIAGQREQPQPGTLRGAQAFSCTPSGSQLSAPPHQGKSRLRAGEKGWQLGGKEPTCGRRSPAPHDPIHADILSDTSLLPRVRAVDAPESAAGL